MPFHDPALWRRDAFGSLIHWDAYGEPNHVYGWEIDHAHPLASGGTNALNNLRPLRCKTNRGLGGILGALQGR